MLPYGAAVFNANKVLWAPARPAAYLLDDGKLWPISCLEEITDDNSSITSTDVTTFDSYKQGPALYCLK